MRCTAAWGAVSGVGVVVCRDGESGAWGRKKAWVAGVCMRAWLAGVYRMAWVVEGVAHRRALAAQAYKLAWLVQVLCRKASLEEDCNSVWEASGTGALVLAGAHMRALQGLCKPAWAPWLEVVCKPAWMEVEEVACMLALSAVVPGIAASEEQGCTAPAQAPGAAGRCGWAGGQHRLCGELEVGSGGAGRTVLGPGLEVGRACCMFALVAGTVAWVCTQALVEHRLALVGRRKALVPAGCMLVW